MNRRDFIQSAIISGVGMSSALALAQGKTTGQKYELSGLDVAGKKLDLKDFSGRTVLVSFFTFDCALCTHDLKLMREFYVRNARNKFVLLGVNMDQNKKDLDEYNEATTLAFPKDQRFPTVWRNAPGHKDTFGKVSSLPSHFVLDGKQQLMFKREGAFQADDWDKLWLSLG
jgi:peroxiredoxin